MFNNCPKTTKSLLHPPKRAHWREETDRHCLELLLGWVNSSVHPKSQAHIRDWNSKFTLALHFPRSKNRREILKGLKAKGAGKTSHIRATGAELQGREPNNYRKALATGSLSLKQLCLQGAMLDI